MKLSMGNILNFDLHKLFDRFGVEIEIGDIVASGSGSSACIIHVKELKLQTLNNGVHPENVIVIRAKNPNKKLGW